MDKIKDQNKDQQTDQKRAEIAEIRKACRQYAMLYFHFCKTLVEALGFETARPLIQRAVYQLALDRSEQLRTEAVQLGLDTTLETFGEISDLPVSAWTLWDESMGGLRCPYAEEWVKYYDAYPWFKEVAPLYCDTIDTTNIENFTRNTSHTITKNLLWGDASCERTYFPSTSLKDDGYTYEV